MSLLESPAKGRKAEVCDARLELLAFNVDPYVLTVCVWNNSDDGGATTLENHSTNPHQTLKCPDTSCYIHLDLVAPAMRTDILDMVIVTDKKQ